jgi:tryptophanyl-tRNA synthetase
MSTSDDAPRIELTADRETVRGLVTRHAYSGGRDSLDAHREHGGDPGVDVAFQYLRAVFEPDDDLLERIEAAYRAGDLTTGELKAHAVDRIADVLDAHRNRRPGDASLESCLEPNRLAPPARERALDAVGLGPDVRIGCTHRKG